jgi:ribosomal RNA-processing protein 9
MISTNFFFQLIPTHNIMAVDSFFASARKRKRPTKTTSKPVRKPTRKPAKEESDVEGDDDHDQFDINQSSDSEEESSEEEIQETAAEKRVRLAKAYLGKLEDTLDGKKNNNIEN